LQTRTQNLAYRRHCAGTVLLAAVLLGGYGAITHAQRAFDPDVEAFIEEVARKHDYDRAALRRILAQAQTRPAVIRAISAPVTARPWHEFRSRFVDAARIQGGVKFWREYAAMLGRASSEYGVPPEIIVATIGIETLYGRHTGAFRVLDALTTLAFHYPPRAEFFRGELEEYLLLVREKKLNPEAVRGSYAGAIGIPQFIPSSYRRFAVDFDGDGRRDLSGTTADAIGSVANYYRAHGWRTGEAIVVPATPADGVPVGELPRGIKPQLKVTDFKRLGMLPLAAVDEEAEVAFFVVEAEDGPRYWLGLNNFYVITRYNRSINYALTVHELAQELRALVKPER
jgi:membrane-bound lytic murein transglycosylase B